MCDDILLKSQITAIRIVCVCHVSYYYVLQLYIVEYILFIVINIIICMYEYSGIYIQVFFFKTKNDKQDMVRCNIAIMHVGMVD